MTVIFRMASFVSVKETLKASAQRCTREEEGPTLQGKWSWLVDCSHSQFKQNNGLLAPPHLLRMWHVRMWVEVGCSCGVVL